MAVAIKQPRTHRQYMNRPGGFNRCAVFLLPVSRKIADGTARNQAPGQDQVDLSRRRVPASPHSCNHMLVSSSTAPSLPRPRRSRLRAARKSYEIYQPPQTSSLQVHCSRGGLEMHSDERQAGARHARLCATPPTATADSLVFLISRSDHPNGRPPHTSKPRDRRARRPPRACPSSRRTPRTTPRSRRLTRRRRGGCSGSKSSRVRLLCAHIADREEVLTELEEQRGWKANGRPPCSRRSTRS